MTGKHAMGRRALLQRLLGTTAIAAGASALFPADGALAQVRRRPLASIATPATTGASLANPPHIVAGRDGSYALDIVERTVALGPQLVRVRAFVDANNLDMIAAPLVGPTITLAGNTTPRTEGNVQNVTVRLANKLPPDADHLHGPGEQPHGFNTTNLHTHGLHVAPDQDNVYVELAPAGGGAPGCVGPTGQDPVVKCRERYDYSYAFGQTPGNGKTKLPAGTYWYHPHKHGSVGLQVASGMSGALIVQGDLDAVPGVAGLVERVMVVQLVEYTPTAGSAVATIDPATFYNFGTVNNQISINGQINPGVAMQAGEIQRWRVVNATAAQFFYFNVVPNAAGAPVPQLYAIATDGIALTTNGSQMTVPYLLGTPVQTPTGFEDAVMNEIAVLSPGQRLDLLVVMPATAVQQQTYALQAVSFPGADSGQTIATLQVVGAKTTADVLPDRAYFSANPPAPALPLFRPPIALPSTPASPTQRLEFAFTGPNQSLSTINGKQFAAPPPPQIPLKLNAVDLWHVTGYGAPHAFHIHINSFVMSKRNGIPILAAAIWRDTVRLDTSTAPTPGSTTPAALFPVEFVSQQLDYTGDFVLHCHVLQHEDTGMMLSVAITS